jgi:hypothetical protein
MSCYVVESGTLLMGLYSVREHSRKKRLNDIAIISANVAKREDDVCVVRTGATFAPYVDSR